MDENKVEVTEENVEKKECNCKVNSKPVLTIVIIAVVIVALAAIAAIIFNTTKKDNKEDKNTVSPMVGYYTLVEISENGSEEVINRDTLESIKLLCNLTIEEGNTGVMNFFGEEIKITYDEKQIVMEGTGAKYDYTFADNRITLTDDDEKLVFEKTEKEEATDVQE